MITEGRLLSYHLFIMLLFNSFPILIIINSVEKINAIFDLSLWQPSVANCVPTGYF